MSTVTSCTACKLYSGLNEVSEGGVHLLFPFKQASLCSHYIKKTNQMRFKCIIKIVKTSLVKHFLPSSKLILSSYPQWTLW